MLNVNVKQNEMDPEFHNGTSHTEFRLNDLNVTYLASMRLANVCAFATGAENVAYNRACGVKALISSITLYDGSIVLAQLNNAGPYLAFKGINRNNSDQRDKRKVNLDTVAMMNGSVAGTENLNQIREATTQLIGGAGSTEANATKGYIDLSELLHELRSLRYLPTSVFKNLRLYIQWNTDPAAVLGGLRADIPALTIGRPMLVVDMIADPKVQSQLLSSIRQTSMIAIENERVTIPTIDANAATTKTTDLVLKGYDNKTLRRILLVNSPTDAVEGVIETDSGGNAATNKPILCNGRLNSLAQNNLKVQLTVNGANLFNGNGLTGHNRRAAVLADTFGDIILTPYGNSVGVYGVNTNNGAAHGQVGYAFGRDYTGFSVNAAIRTLQLSYTRTGLATGIVSILRPQAMNQQLDLNIYAEVIKIFRIGDGGYNIAYI